MNAKGFDGVLTHKAVTTMEHWTLAKESLLDGGGGRAERSRGGRGGRSLLNKG